MPGRFASLFVRRPPMNAPSSPPPDGDVPPSESAPGPPPPGRLRRPPRPMSPERARRELIRQRELEMRDVGGLAVEMARRDDWRYGLLHARCAEVLGLEERIHELDALMATSEIAAHGVGAVQCKCGAPILRGSHFCSHCGRPASETPPAVTCSHCGQPLPADANFCPVCGNGVAAEAFDADTSVEAPRPHEGGGP
jgi:Double zinc ribbon